MCSRVCIIFGALPLLYHLLGIYCVVSERQAATRSGGDPPRCETGKVEKRNVAVQLVPSEAFTRWLVRIKDEEATPHRV